MKYKYAVLEIFDSVQGEGRFSGMPVTFIRLSGCNLDCPWCDTKELLSSEAKIMSLEEIVEKVSRPNVVITGGEPTIQNIEPLCNAIREKFFGRSFLMIETNGTGYVPLAFNYIACSPKPQSGYKIDDSILSREHLVPIDYKYVVDENLKEDDIHIPDNSGVRSLVYLQPEYYSGKKSVDKAYKLLERLGARAGVGYCVRLGIQAHKVWGVQ